MKDKYRLRIPRLNSLSRDELERIHLATLEVLRCTGVAVKEAKAIELFKRAGCTIDGERVRIPSQRVKQAFRNIPPRVTLCDRNGSPAMFL